MRWVLLAARALGPHGASGRHFDLPAFKRCSENSQLGPSFAREELWSLQTKHNRHPPSHPELTPRLVITHFSSIPQRTQHPGLSRNQRPGSWRDRGSEEFLAISGGCSFTAPDVNEISVARALIYIVRYVCICPYQQEALPLPGF